MHTNIFPKDIILSEASRYMDIFLGFLYFIFSDCFESI